MKFRILLSILTLSFSFCVASVFAADASRTQEPTAVGLHVEEATAKAWHDKPPVECQNRPYIFASGTKSGTYSKVVRDIAKFKECGKFFCELPTQGGYNNSLHLAHNDVELGLVQVDGLAMVGAYDQHVQDLRSLASLYPAGAHVIALAGGFTYKKDGDLRSTTIVPKSLSDIKGMPVAVWSSALVTARNLDEVNGLGLRLVTVTTTDEGIAMVRDGRVAAFISMGGRPVEWVKKLDRTFKLIPMSEQEISAMIGKYPKSGYSKDSLTYDNLGQVGVPTIASQVEIVVQNFQGSRGSGLEELRTCILENIHDIREGQGAHQSWKLVKNPEKTVWPSYEGPKKKKQVPQAPASPPKKS